MGQQIVALDQHFYVALALAIAFRVLGAGGVVNLNHEALESPKKLFRRNEAVAGKVGIAALQGLDRDAAEHLTFAIVAVKTHTISVEKSKFIEECKFRHSSNSAISTFSGRVWNLPYIDSSMVFGAPLIRIKACAEKASILYAMRETRRNSNGYNHHTEP